MPKMGVLVASISLAMLCANLRGGPVQREVIKRGKAATALVEVTHGEAGASGTAFCVDRCLDGSGLFVTNAHVVADEAGKVGTVRLVVDIGLETQRILAATVVRHDDEMDLALLRVEQRTDRAGTGTGRGSDARFERSHLRLPLRHPDRGRALRVPRYHGAPEPDHRLPPRKWPAHGDPVRQPDQPGQFGRAGPGRLGQDRGRGTRDGDRGRAQHGHSGRPLGRIPECSGPGLRPAGVHVRDRNKPVLWTIRLRPSEDEVSLPDSCQWPSYSRTAPASREPSWPSGPAWGLQGDRDPCGTRPRLDCQGEVWVDRGIPGEQFTTGASDRDARGGWNRLALGLLRKLLAGRSPRAATDGNGRTEAGNGQRRVRPEDNHH